MVTRRVQKPVLTDEWQPVGTPCEMPDGPDVQRWQQPSTGLTKLVPVGLHPLDQPLQLAIDQNVFQGDDDIAEETATDRVATMLAVASSSERAELKVYRVNQGALEFCKGFQPAEFEDGNFDMLRDRFGAGVYELRLYATNPTSGKFAVRSKTRVTIAVDNGATKLASGMDAGMAQFLQQMAQGQAQMLAALVEMKQTPQKDATEEMAKMLTLMATMREAMGLNQPQGRGEKSSIGEIVSAIRELRGAADEIIPQAEKGEPSLMGMLPQILDLVKQGQQAQQTGQAYATNPAPVMLPQSFNAAPVQAHSEPPIPDQQTAEDSHVNLMAKLTLLSYMKTLQGMAQAAKPFSEGAQFIYDKLPDELIEIMALENWFDLLSAVTPDVTPHKDWFTHARDLALAMFDNDETADKAQAVKP